MLQIYRKYLLENFIFVENNCIIVEITTHLYTTVPGII
jgi:hypothetical protein